jgi:hypothetical protein
MGEANETQSWLDDALDCGYITPAQHQDLDLARQRLGGRIATMIAKSDQFCGRPR